MYWLQPRILSRRHSSPNQWQTAGRILSTESHKMPHNETVPPWIAVLLSDRNLGGPWWIFLKRKQKNGCTVGFCFEVLLTPPPHLPPSFGALLQCDHAPLRINNKQQRRPPECAMQDSAATVCDTPRGGREPVSARLDPSAHVNKNDSTDEDYSSPWQFGL